MDPYQAEVLKRQTQEMEFALWIEYKGDWPLFDWFSPEGGQRSIGWLLGQLWEETSGARCPLGDLMPDSTAEALRLPRGGDGLTFSYGLRLVRRNLNWLARLAGP
jgi:hypothetical protein